MTAQFTADESARRRLRELNSPLILSAGEYKDTAFVVPMARFKPSTVSAALYGPKGMRRVTFRNCTLRTDAQTWDPAWAADPLLSALAGVRLDSPQEFVVDGLHVEGFPECGLTAHAVDLAKFERFSSTRCFMGMNFCWVDRANRNMRIDGARVWDTWGPGPGLLPGIGGAASRLRPGGFSGGDGIAGYFEDAMLARLDFSGEMYAGLKLVRSKRACLVDVATNHLMIQGTQGEHANDDGTTDGSEDITVRRLTVNKRRCSGDITEEANGIQVSRNVTGLDVEDFLLLADGTNGHGIQLWGNCRAKFRGGLISGFNGLRGASPAYALETGDGSAVNASFEIANRFHNQARILRAA